MWGSGNVGIDVEGGASDNVTSREALNYPVDDTNPGAKCGASALVLQAKSILQAKKHESGNK